MQALHYFSNTVNLSTWTIYLHDAGELYSGIASGRVLTLERCMHRRHSSLNNVLYGTYTFHGITFCFNVKQEKYVTLSFHFLY